MIKNGTLKLSYIGSSSMTSLRYLSTQSTNSGKDIYVKFTNESRKPIVLPSDPMPSIPFPTVPHPVQTPVIEIPGPIVEPTLPQSQPQSQPQLEPEPGYKPSIEIPVPNRNAHKNVQDNNEDDVLFKDIGSKGVITLNRPKALNALNLSMVDKIYPVLKEWESSKKLVIIEGAGEKAFCAGGDIKSVVIEIKANNIDRARTFFKTEYTLDHLIGTYKVPYVALINGITMGGGCGLSVNGKYRIATEKTLFAMPETAIGFFCDVGGTYFLPRLKGKLGVYLGLTGSRLKGVDVLHAGIATHFVPSEKLSDLKQELLTTEVPNITEVLNKYQPQNLNQEFCLAPYMNQIDKCFSASSVEEIVNRLKEDNSEWAGEIIQTLMKMSPASLKITMRAMQKGSNLSLADCLKMEYRLAYNYSLNKDSDFCEGVRALLIDKDQKPAWNPKSLDQVTDTYVNQQFALLTDGQEMSL